MAKINFKIVTPEKSLLSQEVDSLTCPTMDGQVTILPGHIPLIAALQPGELVVRKENDSVAMAVSGGFIEVRPGNEVIILADTAEHALEIDEAKAQEARDRAARTMKESVIRSEEEYATIRASLEKHLVRLKVAKKHASKRSITPESIRESN